MEYATFAHMLQRVRTDRLDELTPFRHALVMGDGDGRFLQALLAANAHVRIDAVDASAVMLRLSQKRAAFLGKDSADRVTWHLADARLWQPRSPVNVPRGTSIGYDLVVTHFFLDCFSSAEVNSLIAKTNASMEPGALWVNSDFSIPPRGLMRWLSSAIVKSLYLGFRLLTGLETSRLPDDESAFRQAGMQRESQQLFLGGLMKSELWRKPDF